MRLTVLTLGLALAVLFPGRTVAAPVPWAPNVAGSYCICGTDCKCEPGKCPAECPVVNGEQFTYQKVCTPDGCKLIKVATVPTTSTVTRTTITVNDGLDELNSWRTRNGFRAFRRDARLTEAAQAAANFRAAQLLFGHTDNDFKFLPSGATASAAGCAAYPANYGWLSCCMREDAEFAGAAWAPGADGKRYMHVFVRKEGDPNMVASTKSALTPYSLSDCSSCSAATSGPVVTTSTVTVRTSVKRHPIRGFLARLFRRG